MCKRRTEDRRALRQVAVGLYLKVCGLSDSHKFPNCVTHFATKPNFLRPRLKFGLVKMEEKGMGRRGVPSEKKRKKGDLLNR